MNEEKIKEVFSDEEFVKSLIELETPEEVQKVLTEKGIDLSTDEIQKIAELLQKKSNGELTDADLENIAGGMKGVIAVRGMVTVIGGIMGSWAVTDRVLEHRW